MNRGSVRLVALAVLLAASLFPVAAKEPERIVVQHVLISFEGKIPGKEITRSKKEAKALAEELLQRATGGEEFDALVKEYTDDTYPGIYKMANLKVPVLPEEKARTDLVAKFGDVAFRLEVGEVGLASFNSYTSPYGWHIIKRLE